MNPELHALNQRVEAAIHRTPDRLSARRDGDDLRAEFGRIFALCIGGEVMPVRMFGVLALPLHLLTDPWLFRPRTGWVVLDHPQEPQAFAWAFEQRDLIGHVCPRWWRLHENAHPRLFVIPDEGRVLSAADVRAAVGRAGFHGPFEAPPVWCTVGQGPFRSLVRVERPVAPAWLAPRAN
jgi:hypothetical protein